MKKTVLLVILMTLVTVGLSATTKMSMEIWNRWTYETYDGETTENSFAVERGYFRLEPTFGNNISGRFNIDWFSSDKSSDTNGAGLKLKYAYLDFANVIPIKDSKLTVGLMKTYFGTIYDWDYTTIEKDPSDLYKFVSSTDYGLGISGYLPNGFGTYAIAAYNGEGYKKALGNVNTAINPLVDIRFIPIPGVTIGGSYFMANKNNDEVDGEPNPDREEYTKIAGVGKFAYGPAYILAQYLMMDTDRPNDDEFEKFSSSVLSAMGVVKVSNRFDIVARYDMYDPNTDADDDGSTLILGGFNYHIMKDEKNKPKLFVQVNFEQMSYEMEDSEPINKIMAQLRWIFSETIN